MAMTFDQRMNNSMRDINSWTENPPCANIDGVSTNDALELAKAEPTFGADGKINGLTALEG